MRLLPKYLKSVKLHVHLLLFVRDMLVQIWKHHCSSGAMVSGASTTLGAGRAAGELKTELPARRGVASEKLRTREDEE